jgi:hypothetical protein
MNVYPLRPHDQELEEWSSSWVKCTDLEWSVLTMAARKAKMPAANEIADRIITDVKRQQRLRLEATKHPTTRGAGDTDGQPA